MNELPPFDDSKPLFVFDGICVLCSGGANWLMRADRAGRVNLASAQSPLGQALYAHFGMKIDESYLLIDQGRAYTASAGYLHLAKILGGPWHIFRLAAMIPERWRDRIYNLIARNRYRWFGKADYCTLLTPGQRARLLR
jgi:predicted DCC family thiol-disulfide oxidoreductase YuxK